jgi:3-methylcrotonyl-CoA carboxylase alpha subunit
MTVGASANHFLCFFLASAGDEVSVYYDPMISKLIVHAESRPAALRKLVFALSRYQIGGISSNIQFLTAVSTHPAFVKGEVTTKFIDVCRRKHE